MYLFHINKMDLYNHMENLFCAVYSPDQNIVMHNSVHIQAPSF